MFRRKTLTLLLLLCLMPISLGATGTKVVKDGISYEATRTYAKSTAVIKGPITATVGSTVFLKLSEPADWISWKLIPENANASFMSFQSYLGMTPDNKPILQHLAIFSTMTPGTYYFSVAATGQIHLVHTLTITGNGPGPEPPIPPIPVPPVPTPGHRFVLLLQETSEPSVALSKTIQALRPYLQEKKHEWRIEDKDLVDSQGKVPAWLLPFKEQIAKMGYVLPVLAVGYFDEDGKTVIGVKMTPLDPKTTTAEKAIEFVKSCGG